jgi:hypothetical protein
MGLWNTSLMPPFQTTDFEALQCRTITTTPTFISSRSTPPNPVSRPPTAFGSLLPWSVCLITAGYLWLLEPPVCRVFPNYCGHWKKQQDPCLQYPPSNQGTLAPPSGRSTPTRAPRLKPQVRPTPTLTILTKNTHLQLSRLNGSTRTRSRL